MTAAKNPVPISLSSVELKLDLIENPRPLYNRGRRWVLWGKNHQFMQQVLDLIQKSPTAAAVFNQKAKLVAGDGFKYDAAQYPKLAEIMGKMARSGKYKTGNAVLKRVVQDFTRLRGRAYQVVWAQDGEHIAEIHPQRFKTVAPGPMNDEGNIEYFWLCRDWKRTSVFEPKEIPAFNPERAKMRKPLTDEQKAKGQKVGDLLEPVQLYWRVNEGAEGEYCPELEFEPSLKYMELEGTLADFHGGNVATNFSANTIITLNNGPQDYTDEKTGENITAASQRTKFEEAFEKKYSGAKGKRIMFLFGDGSTAAATDMAKIDSFGMGGSEALYTTYANLAQQAILSALSCTSPVVAGLPGAGGLGNKGTELREAFDLFYNAVCRPDQAEILEDFKELLSYVDGVSFEGEDPKTPILDITTTLPVKFTYSENLLELICTDDELRADIGKNPLPAGAKPAVTDPNSAPPAPGAPTAMSRVESILLLMAKDERLADLILDNAGLQEQLFGVKLTA